MARSSRPPRGTTRQVRTSSVDRRRERWLKLQVAAIVLLIVGALIYNWYAQRSATDPTGGESQVERGEENTGAATAEDASREKVERDDGKSPAPRPKSDKASPASKHPSINPKLKGDPRPEPKISAVVENVSIKNLDGRVIYRGQVNLQPTLDRIASGQKLRFPNDGSTFQNREGRLPKKPAGYYREWVHPTPKLEGPGPQRVVTGKQDEVYYSHDHYRTFQRIE